MAYLGSLQHFTLPGEMGTSDGEILSAGSVTTIYWVLADIFAVDMEPYNQFIISFSGGT